MEPISAIVLLLLGIIAPVGLISDRIAENQIRKQLTHTESLQVRIDNAPTYQLLGGKLNKVRLAGRGLFVTPDIRIDTLDIETDPIALAGLSAKLAKPLQGAFRIILTETDINRALNSPQFNDRLKSGRYQVTQPQVKLLEHDRISFQAQLTEARYPGQLKILIEGKLSSTSGKTLQLENATFQLNDKPVQPIVLKQLFPSGIPGIDLTQYEVQGITSRILKLETQPNGQLELIGFLQIRPDTSLLK